MTKINNLEAIKKAISELETLKKEESALLKIEFLKLSESLKPINMIKRSIKETFGSTETKDQLLGSVAGIATGYLSKALVVGTSHNPIKKIAGSLLQLVVTNSISRHPEMVVSITNRVSQWLSKKEKTELP